MIVLVFFLVFLVAAGLSTGAQIKEDIRMAGTGFSDQRGGAKAQLFASFI
jgi:hypothetical protein